MKNCILIVLFFLFPFFASSQVVTQGGIPVSSLIQDTLITGCVTASNIVTNNSPAFGYFSNESQYFPFTSGIILASGEISNAQAPNNSSGASGTLNLGGDNDLQMLLPGYDIYDATIIEFDFIPASDTIRFNYIFGSEEFPEYVPAQEGQGFNDVFGFFISGPGINGPYSNDAINIALLPNGEPVTIFNAFATSYYVGSTSGSGGDGLAYNNTVQYDGCTIPLTAEAIVQSCETYHIKLAVGDAGDGALDSGVFIEAGSFTSGIQVDAINHSDVGTETDLYEGCTNYFVLERVPGSPLDQPVIVNVEYTDESTATEGVDVSVFDTEIYIPAGEFSDTLFYTAYNDGIEEGDEYVILEFSTACPCGNGSNVVNDTIFLFDVETIKGGIQDMETNYCGIAPPPTLDIISYVEVSPAYYLWDNGSTNDTLTIIPSVGAETFHVTISDQCGNEFYDSVTIRVSSMTIENIETTEVSCYNECDGSITMDVQNDFQPFTYIYGNANYFYIPDSLTTTMDPVFTGLCPNEYYVKVIDNIGCYIETEVEVPNKPNIELSNGIISSAENYCETPGDITIEASANVNDANFEWWNGTTGSTVTFTPETGDNTYTVSITDNCGNEFVDNINIAVSELSLEPHYEPDLNNSCEGIAWVIPSGGITPYTYYWDDPINAFGQYQEELCVGDYTVEVTDAIGCQAVITVNVLAESGIYIDNNDRIKIYPNPAKQFANIDISDFSQKGAEIKIVNITGQTIGIYHTTESIFRTPKLKPGTYFIEINCSTEHTIIDKLIITD